MCLQSPAKKHSDYLQWEHRRRVVCSICWVQPHWKCGCRMQFESVAPGAEVSVRSIVTLKSRWTGGRWVDEDMSVGMLTVICMSRSSLKLIWWEMGSQCSSNSSNSIDQSFDKCGTFYWVYTQTFHHKWLGHHLRKWLDDRLRVYHLGI